MKISAAVFALIALATMLAEAKQISQPTVGTIYQGDNADNNEVCQIQILPPNPKRKELKIVLKKGYFDQGQVFLLLPQAILGFNKGVFAYTREDFRDPAAHGDADTVGLRSDYMYMDYNQEQDSMDLKFRAYTYRKLIGSKTTAFHTPKDKINEADCSNMKPVLE